MGGLFMKKLLSFILMISLIFSPLVSAMATDSEVLAADLTYAEKIELAEEYIAKGNEIIGRTAAGPGTIAGLSNTSDFTNNEENAALMEKQRWAVYWYHEAALLGYPAAMNFFMGARQDNNLLVKDFYNSMLATVNGPTTGSMEYLPYGSGYEMAITLGEIAIADGILTIFESVEGDSSEYQEKWGLTSSTHQSYANNVSETLGNFYTTAEAIATAPEYLNYERGVYLYLLRAETDKKAARYAAIPYYNNKLEAPEGYTNAEIALEYMLVATGTGDSSANTWLGMWYLNEDGSGPDLPVSERETKYTTAKEYLLTGLQIDAHGSVRQKQNGLEALAKLYEFGSPDGSVPISLENAEKIYQIALLPNTTAVEFVVDGVTISANNFWPTNENYMRDLARVQAKIAAAENQDIAVIVDEAAVAFSDNQTPELKGTEVFVPADAIFEALGLPTNWDSATETFTAGWDVVDPSNDDVVSPFYVSLTADSTDAYINQKSSDTVADTNRTMLTLTDAQTPYVSNGELYVSLSFVAAIAGFEMDWNAATSVAELNTPAVEAFDTSLKTDGTEIIEYGGYEWIVIAQDPNVNGGKALVIAKDIIDYSSMYAAQNTYITWEYSDLRAYLNGEFYDELWAVESQEPYLSRRVIQETTLKNDDNVEMVTLGGNDTTDKIFLLSMNEYLAFVGEESEIGATGEFWWLRTNGVDQRQYAVVNPEGNVGPSGLRLQTDGIGVRPAMWISLYTDPSGPPQRQAYQLSANEAALVFDRPMGPQTAYHKAQISEDDGLTWTDVEIASVSWSDDAAYYSGNYSTTDYNEYGARNAIFTFVDDFTPGSMYRVLLNNGYTATWSGNATNTASFTVADDTTAPTLSAGSASRTSANAAAVSFTTTEAGTAYYLVLDQGESAPTNEAIIAQGTPLNDRTTVSTGTSLGLIKQAGAISGVGIPVSGGAKDLYVVVMDANGNISDPLKVNASDYPTGGDTTAPKLSNASISRTSDTSATINFTTDEAGLVYYMLFESEATDLTKLNINNLGSFLGYYSAGSIESEITMTAGAKILYVLVHDESGNLSDTLKILIPTQIIGGTISIAAQSPAEPDTLSPGDTLKADVSGITPEGAAVTYQWYLDGELLTGETGDTYVIPADAWGKEIKVVVTGAGDYYGCVDSYTVTVRDTDTDTDVDTLKSYIAGYPDGTFRPDEGITRAEAAQMLYNIINGDVTTSPISPYSLMSAKSFTDVEAGDWFYKAVTYLADVGIISGYPDGSFRPGNTITRSEFTAMVVQYMGLSTDGVSDFPDVPSGYWATGFIAAAKSAGIITGYPGGIFAPENNVTRAETVTILNHMMERSSDKNLLGGLEMPFNDVPDTHWAYYQIIAAAVEHEA